ncbi:hypothetical protein SLS53_004419 [Cytospora paraplurivora]|uniref:Protein kinase domain-containing protein n=1 Tax=Cytospora paraplurivora TaxID=2898453 RepID=A0AAN9UA36_9PEZI
MPNSEHLDLKILRCYTESEFPPGWKQRYIPEGCLDQLFSRQTIIQEFTRGAEVADEHHVDEYLEDLISFILLSAKKLMAICLMSGVDKGELRQALEIFKSNQFDDKSLPLLSLDADHPPWSQLDWSPIKLSHFNGDQWRFYAPIFSKDNIKLVLENQHILPFQLASREPKLGAFSEVYEVTIHEAHQKEPMQKLTGGHATAAIKAFRPPATPASKLEVDKEWEREEKALEEMRGLHHAHIVEVKAMFTWKGKGNYFMFQWADGGNLRDLFQNNQQPTLTKDLIKEIVQQLMGLADALVALHNLKKDGKDAGSYRHGDLKPENILIFKDNTDIGMFKIADMGLAKHHFDDTGN